MGPPIRPANGADKPAIIDMLRDTPEFAPVDVQVAGELLDCYLEGGAESGYDVWVSEVDGAVSGYVCFGSTPLTQGTWDLYWIAVGRRFRNRGIGSALVGFTEGRVKKAGGRMVLIETSSTPPYRAARHLYRRLGYRMAARVRDFYLPGDDKLIFQKVL